MYNLPLLSRNFESLSKHWPVFFDSYALVSEFNGELSNVSRTNDSKQLFDLLQVYLHNLSLIPIQMPV
jgi:hypothetical protein